MSVTDSFHANIAALLEAGEAMRFRGYSENYLFHDAGITAITAKKLELYTAATAPTLGLWAREIEAEGYLLSQLPIYRRARVVGMQFRAYDPAGQDRAQHIRTFGESEGLFIPHYYGRHPMAIVAHEGPWDAVACNHDARVFQNMDVLSVAIISASVTAYTIRTTLDAVFPGVPRFSLFDQDDAGILARMATSAVIKPILVNGAGYGKGFDDLNRHVRFECLVDVVERELKLLGYL